MPLDKIKETSAITKFDAGVLVIVDEIPDIAWDLVELSAKPLTIIYSGARNLAPELLGDDGSVGIRVTQESFSQALCRKFRKPIVSTSANLSGEPSPATFDDIPQAVKDAVDYVCTSRRNDRTPARPSSIIKLAANGEIKIIRE